MATKIQQKTAKKQIITQNFTIDSFRLSIDIAEFKSVIIPENYILVDEDTGEEISRFKKKSLAVPYKNTIIYIAKFITILNNNRYDKLIILFSSKASGENYFNGIKKETVINVLEHLKNCGYIDYDDVNYVINHIYCSDTDIKKDNIFEVTEKNKIVKYNKELISRFQFESNEIISYNNKKQLGLQCFHRNNNTSLKKTFVKWYNKSLELQKKHLDFFNTLPYDVRTTITQNLIYRFEFTIKNKKHFAKFGLSNKLVDVLEVVNDKWIDVSKSILNMLFQVKMKQLKDTSKLDYKERILAYFIVKSMQVDNLSLHQVKTIFTSQQPYKQLKSKASDVFDKIYHKVIEEQKSYKYIEDYNNIIELDKLFGFI